MTDVDRIYQLFIETNPVPADAAPTTERPDAAVILNEQRNPTMLTEEPRTIGTQSAPVRFRRWRGPAIALASFIGVVALGATGLLLLTDGDSEVANGGTLPPVTTTLPSVTTTLPDVVVPSVVSVPDLSGLTLAQARAILGDAGLEVMALPAGSDADIVVAQEPAPGVEVDAGTVVTVDVQVVATCNPPDPVAPGPGQVIISVFFECGNDDIYPTAGVGVPRIVAEETEAVDRIELTMRSLLAGLTPDEQAVGFVSAFDTATADALNSVTLTDGRLVVDFNEAIIVNNMSTSTGMVQFHAELHRNVFGHPEVDGAEFRLNGNCEAWSALFESDGCPVTSRAEWEQNLAEWDNARNQ